MTYRSYQLGSISLSIGNTDLNYQISNQHKQQSNAKTPVKTGHFIEIAQLSFEGGSRGATSTLPNLSC